MQCALAWYSPALALEALIQEAVSSCRNLQVGHDHDNHNAQSQCVSVYRYVHIDILPYTYTTKTRECVSTVNCQHRNAGQMTMMRPMSN